MRQSEKPDIPANGRYSIKQTCELMGIHRHTLRKYTKEGYIKVYTTRLGRQYYVGRDIINFWWQY